MPRASTRYLSIGATVEEIEKEASSKQAARQLIRQSVNLKLFSMVSESLLIPHYVPSCTIHYSNCFAKRHGGGI